MLTPNIVSNLSKQKQITKKYNFDMIFIKTGKCFDMDVIQEMSLTFVDFRTCHCNYVKTSKLDSKCKSSKKIFLNKS